MWDTGSQDPNFLHLCTRWSKVCSHYDIVCWNCRLKILNFLILLFPQFLRFFLWIKKKNRSLMNGKVAWRAKKKSWTMAQPPQELEERQRSSLYLLVNYLKKILFFGFLLLQEQTNTYLRASFLLVFYCTM